MVHDIPSARPEVNASAVGAAQWTPAVVFVSPTYFAPESVIGGGERYAEELSRAMSERTSVRFVSFGPKEFRERVSDRFERIVLKSWTRDKITPFSPLLWRELLWADVVHSFQYFTTSTFMSALFGRLRGIPVFVSDLGGGGWTPAYHIDQSRWISAHLPISQYAARGLPGANRRHQVILGGVELARYPLRSPLEHDGSVVFLGRILRHKGIHHLINAVPQGMVLRIIGPAGDADYLQELIKLSDGKAVEFLHGLDDLAVGGYLRTAMALVHPTPTDAVGNAGVNELLGLAVLEAMASGCPVVVSDAASLPELIEPEVSGLIVEPNNPAAISSALRRLQTDAGLWARLALAGRRRVEAEFTWARTVERCFAAYRAAATHVRP